MLTQVTSDNEMAYYIGEVVLVQKFDLDDDGSIDRDSVTKFVGTLINYIQSEDSTHIKLEEMLPIVASNDSDYIEVYSLDDD